MRIPIVFGVAAAAVMLAGAPPAAAQIRATVIDRGGNRYEVSGLAYQGRSELEVWIGGERRLVSLAEIDRLRLSGEPADENLPILLTLRTGGELRGTIFAGGSGVVPQGSTGGGAQPTQRFTGVTDLGPFLVRLSDVGEVLFRHEGEARPEPDLRASIVTAQGERFEVRGLRYRSGTQFEYLQGPRARSLEMERLARLEFADAAPNTETRQVTITFRSGKVVQGTVDAGTVRLAGETDHQYEMRVLSAFTARTASGPIRLGLHQVRLIRFEEPARPGDGEGDPDGGSPGAG
ncbi:MAG: hypothetical protein ABIL09_01605 [Gemmatimonadota bacterium]